MAADYDAGEITDRERQAAKNQTKISRKNVRDTMNQLSRQLSNYDLADKQNRDLADVQLQQNSRKTEADRFEAQRDLQNSALGLLGSMGTAMNGSSTGNFMNMLRSRNDKENNTYWAQLQSNQDSVENAYQDSLNQNNIARRDAMQSAEKAIRDTEAEWSANLNNINPNLFKIGTVDNDKKLSSKKAWTPSKIKSTKSGYVIPQFNATTLLSDLSGDASGTVTQAWTPSKVKSTKSGVIPQFDAATLLSGLSSDTSGTVTQPRSKVKSTKSGVIPQFNAADLLPSDTSGTVTQPRRNVVRGGDYFSRLMNRFNR